MGLHHAAQVHERRRSVTPPSPAPHESIVVQLPRCWKAPYGPSGAVETVVTNVGFTQDDARLPPQPNNAAVIADVNTGICGHSTVWSHDAGLFDRSNASLEMDRSAMVGAWMRVGRMAPTVWANFTSQGEAAVTEGDVHVFGSGGSAMLSCNVQIDVFDAGQPLGSPPWSNALATTELTTSNLDSRQERDLQAGAKVQVAGSPTSLHLSPGEWILVMAVVVARHVVSLNGATLTASTGTTWQVTSICAWL
jgi:hypothetical protein